MKAAVVREAGKPPVYGDFPDPSPAPGKSVIRVRASALSNLTRNRASGKHYSSNGVLPLIPGVDGVGTTSDGQRVFFIAPDSPYGGMAEYTLVDADHFFPIPDTLTDDVAAAMANPGMSSWAALVYRARLRSGETVLINGATGSSGRLAIQIAKHLGAGNVIATGRRAEALDEARQLGADATVLLTQEPPALEAAFGDIFARRVDVVLDYLWGTSAQTLIVAAAKAGPPGVPIRFVQIGSISGGTITLPSAALRSSSLELLGSGIGSVAFPDLLASIRGVLDAAPSAGFQTQTESMPLAEVASAWAREDSDARIVLHP